MKNLLTIVKHGDCELIRGHGQASLPEHTHKSFTMVLFTAGCLFVSVNGARRKVKAGTVIVLPPDNSISLSACDVYDYLSLSVHDKMCVRIMSYLSESPCVFTDSGIINAILADFDAVASEEDFIDRLGIFLQRYSPAGNGARSVAEVVKKAREYIEEHITDGISVADVALGLDVTSSYLARVFKKFMKITPKQYLIQCRLREAKRKMEDDVRDADIAYETGFASQGHLCTIFKKYMGISVGDYKGLIHKK